MGLAAINIKFTADLRGFSTEMQNSIRRIGTLGKELQTAGRGLSTFVTLPLVAAGAAAVKFASDYEESVNKVNVAFGPAANSVKEFAKTSLESFGIAEGTALDLAATYGDMATALGLPVENAAAMSKSLVGLAGDLASFKNISIDIANTALTSIFTGETESLKKLGIVMTEANLQAFALSQGINKQVKDMSQAEKVGLRYNYVLSVTKNAQGDFARTGGGAANQMRIFQESLKQIAQQLGAVILPLFTKAITFVNGLIKEFSGLSDETKTTIVVVAGIAAAIGPLLTVMGSLLTFVPNVITKFNALKDAFAGLQALIVANPFGALIVALAAIASYVLIANSRFSSLTDSTKEFNEVNLKASQSIAKQSAELDKNLAIAKNNKFSLDQRKKAIEDINSLSPEYLGNITLENINTDKTTEAVKRYNQAMLTKAKVIAAEEKLVDVQKRLLDLQLGNLDAVKPSVWQNLAGAIISYGNAGAGAAFTSQSIAKNLGIESAELSKLQKQLIDFIGVNKEYKDGNDAVNLSLENTIKAQQEQLKAGTIDFYEKQISDLQKIQNGVVTTTAEWKKYQDQIDAVQKKIDTIQNKDGVKLPKPELPTDEAVFTPSFSLEELNSQLTYYEQQRDRFSKTSEDFAYYSQQVNNTKLSINAIEGVDEVNAQFEQIESDAEKMRASLHATLVDGLGNAFSTMSENMVESLGLAESGLQGFMAGLAKTVLKLLSMYLAQSISASIAGATASGAATGPAAFFTTPGFIAAAVSGVIAAFAAIPKFETGGVVGGSSFYGDKILARVNSRELILNDRQQRSLYNQLNSSQVVAQTIIPDVKISGSDLLIVFDRANSTKNRIG